MGQKIVVCQDSWSLMVVVSQDRFHCSKHNLLTIFATKVTCLVYLDKGGCPSPKGNELNRMCVLVVLGEGGGVKHIFAIK